MVISTRSAKRFRKNQKKATSEPAEAKLLNVVTMLTLNFESERRTTPRDDNTVFKIRKDSGSQALFRKASRRIPSRDKMLEMQQRTRENSIKGIQKGSDLMHSYDCSCGAWHS